MKQRAFLLLVSVILVLVGCRRENNGGGNGGGNGDGNGNAVVDLTLTLLLDKPLPQYETVDFVSKADIETSARYVMALYKFKNGAYEETPSFYVVELEGRMSNRSYSLRVDQANYRLLVWVDYSQPDGGSLFYDAVSPTDVSLTGGTYYGNEPLRDAFYGVMELPLGNFQTQHAIYNATVTLTRPNAHFNLVATDQDQFLKTLPGDQKDLSQFKVRISYPQFMPSAFSLVEQRPNDSRTGVEFTTGMSLLEDGSIDLGGDWVFAPKEASSVQVTLSFYDANGIFISSVNNIEVPVCQGKNTTVKGNLLTNGVSNGITIDPGFDGVFTVNI